MPTRLLEWTAAVLSMLVFVFAAVGVVGMCVHFLGVEVWVATVFAIVLVFAIEQLGCWVVEHIDDNWVG